MYVKKKQLQERSYSSDFYPWLSRKWQAQTEKHRKHSVIWMNWRRSTPTPSPISAKLPGSVPPRKALESEPIHLDLDPAAEIGQFEIGLKIWATLFLRKFIMNWVSIPSFSDTKTGSTSILTSMPSSGFWSIPEFSIQAPKSKPTTTRTVL